MQSKYLTLKDNTNTHKLRTANKKLPESPQNKQNQRRAKPTEFEWPRQEKKSTPEARHYFSLNFFSPCFYSKEKHGLCVPICIYFYQVLSKTRYSPLCCKQKYFKLLTCVHTILSLSLSKGLCLLCTSAEHYPFMMKILPPPCDFESQ